MKKAKKCWWIAVTRWNILKTDREVYSKIKGGMCEGDPIVLYQASLDDGKIGVHEICALGVATDLNIAENKYYIKIEKKLDNPVHLDELREKMPNIFSSNPVHNLSKEKRKIVFDTIIEKNRNDKELLNYIEDVKSNGVEF